MAAKIPFMVMEARHYSGREAEAPSSVNSLGPVTCMDSGIEVVEERLNSFTSQLQSECSILERIVYKNKNQHRRCSYFQYLLKVRRDLKLLQSANLEELLNSCFQVIHGKKPKQKVHRLESLKMRKCDGGKYNFMEQLLGAVRLLSEMVELMLKAAMHPSSVNTFVSHVDDELGSKKTDMLQSSEEGPTLISEDDGKQNEDNLQVSNGSEVARISSQIMACLHIQAHY